MTWWWLSFCDPDRPEGSQFLGVAIVEGENIINVVQRSWMLGCNPGGEVACVELPQGFTLPVEWRNRLLTKEEAERCPPPEREREEATS